jgi:hypothetical protein
MAVLCQQVEPPGPLRDPSEQSIVQRGQDVTFCRMQKLAVRYPVYGSRKDDPDLRSSVLISQVLVVIEIHVLSFTQFLVVKKCG